MQTVPFSFSRGAAVALRFMQSRMVGGSSVTLHTALPDEAAEAMLKDAGLQPQRRLTDRSWLIASELGLPSLALANALQETGRFERVQPNWWTARQRK